jgi:hypothetical protein
MITDQNLPGLTLVDREWTITNDQQSIVDLPLSRLQYRADASRHAKSGLAEPDDAQSTAPLGQRKTDASIAPLKDQYVALDAREIFEDSLTLYGRDRGGMPTRK